jgi:hypothetical protein
MTKTFSETLDSVFENKSDSNIPRPQRIGFNELAAWLDQVAHPAKVFTIISES